MRKYLQILLTALIVLPIVFVSCKKLTAPNVKLVLTLPDQAYNYASPSVPGHMRFAIDTTDITDNGATLGRVLFYDKLLSLNNSVACGSCHKQREGFADNVSFSSGIENKLTKRNSMSICNASKEKGFFWDKRADSLVQQVIMPVQNHIEMGMEDLTHLQYKLAKTEYYPALFEKAFGTQEITPERITSALAQFIRSMISCKSKFDQGLEQLDAVSGGLQANNEALQLNNFPNYTAQENQGKTLFFQTLKCNRCHTAPSFRGEGIADIGLYTNYPDNGVGALTGNLSLNGKFAIPTLRNIALTAPYMHDGTFKTLADVVEHYNSGVQAHPNLNWELVNPDFVEQPQSEDVIFFDGGVSVGSDSISPPSDGSSDDSGGYGGGGNNGGGAFSSTEPVVLSVVPNQMHLRSDEKAALVAFLNTLTDYDYVNDPKFSDPFVVVPN